MHFAKYLLYLTVDSSHTSHLYIRINVSGRYFALGQYSYEFLQCISHRITQPLRRIDHLLVCGIPIQPTNHHLPILWNSSYSYLTPHRHSALNTLRNASNLSNQHEFPKCSSYHLCPYLGLTTLTCNIWICTLMPYPILPQNVSRSEIKPCNVLKITSNDVL